MKNQTITLCLIVFLLLAACSAAAPAVSQQNQAAQPPQAQEAPAMPAAPTAPPQPAAPIQPPQDVPGATPLPVMPQPPGVPPAGGRMVIKDAQISLLVYDVDAAATQVTQLATDYNGYLLSSNIGYTDNIRSATLVGLLTGTGIGFLFDLYYKSLNYPSAALVTLAIVVVVLALEAASNGLRKVIL